MRALQEKVGCLHSPRSTVPAYSIGVRIFRYAARYSHDNADSFLEAFLSIPEVIARHLVSGGIDFLLEIVVKRDP
ncbi:hypothetical protein GFL95_34845 [Rhizobium leguminosarum bv. viciae]|nr:hypothetical protein [Rhizobium leguminosarum bv. viciae]